jgi:hypothetical protein
MRIRSKAEFLGYVEAPDMALVSGEGAKLRNDRLACLAKFPHYGCDFAVRPSFWAGDARTNSMFLPTLTFRK